MKKILPVIIGVVAGIIVSVYVIHADEDRIAYGQDNVWDAIVAYGDFFDWNDIFTPSSYGTDLYYLVFDKLLLFPEKDALREVAQKYGLTKDEAQRVIDGSITPIFNIPDRRGAQLTQEDAYVLVRNLQEDFNEISDIFALEQEVDVAIAPSEIFANGDLSDSGFDLVHDLSIMEEILFVDIIENTVGQPFGNQLSSPYLPTEPAQTLEDYVPGGGPGAILEFEFAESGLEESTAGDADISFIEAPLTGVLTIGDEKVNIEVLDEDICPTEEGGYESAIEDYLAEQVEGEEGEAGIEEEGGPDFAMNQAALEEGEGGEGGGISGEGEVLPAAADDWLKSWCPALAAVGDTGAAAGNTFGEAGFSSLGKFTSSLIGQSMGAGAWVQNAGFSLQLGICLDIQMIKKKVSSYQPGDSCVLCEIEKINDILDKTLSHSLIPNKATGNLMESAKCKDSYQALIDMQFIAIAAPVLTPSNDDIIFGKNIFEEWKKFIDRYQPMLFPEAEGVTEFELEIAPEGTTQESIVQSINKVLNRKQAEAKQEIEAIKAVNDGMNIMMQAQTVFGEIYQMRTFFEGYLNQYNKINKELCPAILSKQDI